jgi:carboxymethylenebutenolidase
MEISSSSVEFLGGNSARPTIGYLSEPSDSRRYPGIIIIHEIFGLVDHIKNIADRFAMEGYAALAVDLFEGKTVSKLEEGRDLMGKFTQEKILGDLNGAFNQIKKLNSVSPKRIGSIGFCMGGGLSLLFACHHKELAAAVVFYGRNPTPIDQVKNLSCPVLANYAGADMSISPSDIQLLKENMTNFGKKFDYKIYPGAPHGFFNDTMSRYVPDAAKDAWKRTLNFFNENLKS